MWNVSYSLGKVAGSATAQIFAKATEMERQGRTVAHLEIGQPEFLPIPAVLEATAQAVLQGHVQYTVSKGIPQFRAEISRYYTRYGFTDPEREVIVTSGGKLGIFAAVWAAINPGDNVIILEPSWVSYADIVLSLGGEPRFLPVDLNFHFDQDQMQRMIDAKTKAVIINSPSNPTGAIMSSRTLQELYNICAARQILLISDEMYNEYIYEGTFASLASVKNWKDYGVVINGMSKTFSMTGYRLGYTLSNERIAKEINKIMQLTASCATNFAQQAGIVAFQHLDEMKQRIQHEMLTKRNLILKLMSELPNITYSKPPGAIYTWFKLNQVSDSVKWAADLLHQHGVAVTPGRAFGPSGETYIRLCYATSETAIQSGLIGIKKFLAQGKHS